MAPEIFKGQKNTTKTDIYSFGLIVWEIITKRIPFKSVPYKELEYKMANDQEFFEHYLWSNIPMNANRFLISIAKMCLQYNPLLRPTFSELSSIFEKHYLK